LFQKKKSEASNEYQIEFSKALDVATKGHCPFPVVEKINDTAYNLQSMSLLLMLTSLSFI